LFSFIDISSLLLGDGAALSEETSHVQINMCFLNEGHDIMSPYHHYLFALFDSEEKREPLAVHLKPIIDELRIMKSADFRIIHPITKKSWKFELHFASDMKFLEKCLGLGRVFCLLMIR
jgi:hypothetical protein